MDADEPIYVNDRRVACDGGGGALGHPRVFLEMGRKDEIVCPYCSRRFILAAESESSAAR
jgi:uncharacterized Zn-finger protein